MSLALAAAIGCASEPTEAIDEQNDDVQVTTWSECRGRAEVQLVSVTGAAHAWMGHPSPRPGAEQLVGAPYQDLDASLVIWTFLADHPR